MKKIDLYYEPYDLKLLQPLETSKGKITSRRGFIVILKSDSGIYGTGDISPFPEFGSETYKEAENYLENFRYDLSLDLDDIEKGFYASFRDAEKLPAVRCGLEQALFTLMTNEKNISLNYLLNRKSKEEVKVNGVIGFNNPRTSAKMAEELIYEGYKTIKLKVGRDKFSDDLACIDSVHSTIPATVRLRLDANGKWNARSASEYLEQLEKFNIEYIEQPVNTREDFNKLAGNTKVPLAADESVRNIADAEYFIKSGAVKYIIIKPMMTGGILPLLNIYDKARKNNISVVVTSSFESSIGRAYAVFAASLIEEDIAHGLATGSYFEKRLLPDRYSVKNGVIHL